MTKEQSKTNAPSKRSLPVKIWTFYLDGFRSMTIGKSLWVLILLKLFIMFAILKVFFFPNILSRDYTTDEERAQAVRENLTRRP